MRMKGKSTTSGYQVSRNRHFTGNKGPQRWVRKGRQGKVLFVLARLPDLSELSFLIYQMEIIVF